MTANGDSKSMIDPSATPTYYFHVQKKLHKEVLENKSLTFRNSFRNVTNKFITS